MNQEASEKRYRVAKGKTMTRGDNKVFEEGAVLTGADFTKVGVTWFVELGYLEEIAEDEDE